MVVRDLSEIRKEMNSTREILRGDIYWANLGENKGHIQSGIRPCMIASNNSANKFSTVVLVMPLSTAVLKCKLPTHTFIEADNNNGLSKDSFLMAEQIFPISKDDLGDYIGFTLNDKINKAIEISLGLQESKKENQWLKEVEDTIEKKVETIRGLDDFISKWIIRGGEVSGILIDMEERKLRIKELIAYCQSKGKNIKDYYDIDCINKSNGDNKIRLVG